MPGTSLYARVNLHGAKGSNCCVNHLRAWLEKKGAKKASKRLQNLMLKMEKYSVYI